MDKSTIQTNSTIITKDELLEHWQGHRRLTRRVIEAFPDRELFNYALGGMRPFSELVLEMIRMAGPGIHGIVSGKWEEFGVLEPFSKTGTPKTKNDLLTMWDEVTAYLNEKWQNISVDRFQEKDIAFGKYEDTILNFVFYFIDNEVHHRGQGYVYLRTLGIEPPFFWERH